MIRAAVLLAMAATAAAQPGNTRLTPDPQLRRDFQQTARKYAISPWGYLPSSGYLPYSLYAPRYQPFYGPQAKWIPSAGTWVQVGPPGAGFVPVAVSRESRITDLLLVILVRFLMFAIAAALLAGALPRRLWTEIIHANNIALSILLAALIVGFGIIAAVASP